jgi:hypothetical protein
MSVHVTALCLSMHTIQEYGRYDREVRGFC